jgi:hypothetical protein
MEVKKGKGRDGQQLLTQEEHEVAPLDSLCMRKVDGTTCGAPHFNC